MIMIDGGEIRRVKSVKYVGMIVDDKLTWEQHIEFISRKMVRNIGILKHIRNFILQELCCYFITHWMNLILDTAALFGDNAVRA